MESPHHDRKTLMLCITVVEWICGVGECLSVCTPLLPEDSSHSFTSSVSQQRAELTHLKFVCVYLGQSFSLCVSRSHVYAQIYNYI